MNEEFIHKLQLQAKKQSGLYRQQFLPKQMDFVTALVGNYPWQILFLASLITAFLLEFFKK